MLPGSEHRNGMRIANQGLGLTIVLLLSAVHAAPSGTIGTLETEAITEATTETQEREDEISCPDVVDRSAWGARPPILRELQEGPSEFAVIHHTYIPGACVTPKACAASMRGMQRFHQDDRRFNDIGYNFLIGGDEQVYEGRGWGVVGAHSPQYNSNGVGISFIGDYRTEVPSERMLSLARAVLACGVRGGHLQSNYRLLAHRQVRDTDCPGDALFGVVRTWPHWEPHPPVFVFHNSTSTTAASTTAQPTTTEVNDVANNQQK